ncbi:MAG: hypothetical protein E7218_05175 [Anaerofustis stercorihominis]|nr:hypothetical protein [Anaerofustis stercorihominis]
MGLDKKFDMSELTIAKTVPGGPGAPVGIFTTPITLKENMIRLYEGKTPMWAPFSRGETYSSFVWCDPERIARSNPEKAGGIDGYGIEWVYVPAANGAMVRPGNPKVTDISKWEECVTIPDPDTWDWEGFAKSMEGTVPEDQALMFTVPGCLFERLIACMDYANAVVALIDEDQQEDVHRFFRQVTQVHKKTYSHLKKWFNPVIVNFNDDWGTQRAQAFSVETYKEMIFPYVKEIAEHVHSMGMYFDLHSCGVIEPFVPYLIEAGFDSWGGQPLNDKAKLKELYDNGKFVFTAHVELPMDATEEEMDKAVEEFINGIGKDNRCLIDVRGPEKLREKLYIASRKNYDKLVAEGKAIM